MLLVAGEAPAAVEVLEPESLCCLSPFYNGPAGW